MAGKEPELHQVPGQYSLVLLLPQLPPCNIHSHACHWLQIQSSEDWLELESLVPDDLDHKTIPMQLNAQAEEGPPRPQPWLMELALQQD